MKKIKVAVVGVGNDASSLLQGIFYYRNVIRSTKPVIGLMHNLVDIYKVSDIIPVAAFDIDKRKVGKDLSRAIFEKPNCTKIIYSKMPNLGVKVKMGPVLDGLAEHIKNYPEEERPVVAKEKPINVIKELKNTGAEILINYVPTGAQKVTEFYAKAALETKCAFLNCTPNLIASKKLWLEKFKEEKIPIIGDDIKSQIGATILHRALIDLLRERGCEIKKTYQLNMGGNADFLNMLSLSRRKLKETSKMKSLRSQLLPCMPENNIYTSPSNYVPWLKDNKICYIRIDARNFSGIPLELEVKLSVEDSPNSAGCVIDAIRILKLALERGIGGPIISASAYLTKSPPIQYDDKKAKEIMEEFIKGRRGN